MEILTNKEDLAEMKKVERFYRDTPALHGKKGIVLVDLQAKKYVLGKRRIDFLELIRKYNKEVMENADTNKINVEGYLFEIDRKGPKDLYRNSGKFQIIIE